MKIEIHRTDGTREPITVSLLEINRSTVVYYPLPNHPIAVSLKEIVQVTVTDEKVE